MALSRFLSLITMALLFCSVIAQSPTPSPVSSPKKSPSSSPTPVSSPPTASAPSPSKIPKATAPSPVTVESPPSYSPSPVSSPSSISGPPAEAPGPAENSAVLKLNRFGAAGSVAVGLLTAVMALCFSAVNIFKYTVIILQSALIMNAITSKWAANKIYLSYYTKGDFFQSPIFIRFGYGFGVSVSTFLNKINFLFQTDSFALLAVIRVRRGPRPG
ncbi:classical arabinogalactan protein 1-like [Durio zibethinus]|uniref:Classical arabinogalactan protein 1-like n=1 Tax=Durio zibethinus TaxID=66656 RepID=A0A6P5X9I9_DURZI|nr:classical arabinogalactan protein 1-like [Durio zibethinus]